MFKMYQSVYVTLILEELKSWKSDFSTSYDTFYRVLSSLGFYNKILCVMLYFIFTKNILLLLHKSYESGMFWSLVVICETAFN
jgi:hypothetical protein